MNPDRNLNVNLVLHELSRGWIIEKLAFQLRDALQELGVEAKVSERSSSGAAINHFMIFHYVEANTNTINTMGVTHVDDALKIDIVRKHLATGVRAAICMSAMSVDQLISYGVNPSQLTYALPAHDCAILPRRIVIGITSNNYDDGRKRDWLLWRLSEEIPLDDFEFQIFGRGWDQTRAKLIAAGAKVFVKEPSGDYKADYDDIKSAVPNFDYYLYTGLDEGSLGTLDALAADVKTIVTRQGFHLDIPHAITHGFWEYGELRQIFDEIVRERRSRKDIALSLTWARYAHRHLDIWLSLFERDTLPAPDVLSSEREMRPEKQYPVQGHFSMLRNKLRRHMYLRLRWPKSYEGYLFLRRKVGSALKRLPGRNSPSR